MIQLGSIWNFLTSVAELTLNISYQKTRNSACSMELASFTIKGFNQAYRLDIYIFTYHKSETVPNTRSSSFKVDFSLFHDSFNNEWLIDVHVGRDYWNSYIMWKVDWHLKTSRRKFLDSLARWVRSHLQSGWLFSYNWTFGFDSDRSINLGARRNRLRWSTWILSRTIIIPITWPSCRRSSFAIIWGWYTNLYKYLQVLEVGSGRENAPLAKNNE